MGGLLGGHVAIKTNKWQTSFNHNENKYLLHVLVTFTPELL